jgi:hypothetical protein
MIQRLKSHYEKLLVAGAAIAVAGAVAWAWQARAQLAPVRSQPEQVALAGPVHVAPELPSEPSRVAWTRPAAQSEGAGWVYEVFTPPEIYFNAAARSFAVTPPRYSAEVTETIFGLELLDVRPAPYRLQLAGYFGAPGDYLAAFVSDEVPQTLLARAGRRFEELGLTLKSFDVRKVPVESDGIGPALDIAALAVLWDEQTGSEVVLDSRRPKLTDTPLAVFQPPGGKGGPRSLHEGDTFTDDEATYRIERIQLDPPEVVVARVTPGVPVPEMRILKPAKAATAGGELAKRARPAGAAAVAAGPVNRESLP